MNVCHCHLFAVVECDMWAVPVVEHAIIISKPEHDGLMLPGTVSVTYKCETGYELENPNNNAAECHYEINDREERPADDKAQVVKAIWTGQKSIRCKAG